MPAENRPDWLTYDEASIFAKCDRSTIYRWWKSGLIGEARYTPSGRPLFSRAALEPRIRRKPPAGR